MGSRFVALLVAILFVVGLAAAGIYNYRQQHAGPPHAEDRLAQGESPKPAPSPAESAEPPRSKPTAVPDFDVVRIEPTGEGVIAGRAEPNWTVRVESDGATIAETSADEEGAWTIVLDQPLKSGDHALSLRAISPDGTRALTAQQSVKVAVGEAAAAGEPEVAAKPDEQAAAAANDLASQPQPVYPDENAPREQTKPPVKIGKLDYQDTTDDTGKISLSGVGEPNVQIYLFFDQEPLGEVIVGEDGTWAFEVEKKLDAEEHTIRADTYDEKTHVVQGRASLRLGREPGAAGTETAAQEAAPQPEASPAPEAAPAEPAMAQAGQRSGQPEPVYPDGPPEADASIASPSTSVAAVEPPSLARQPQPVYPEEVAEPEAPPAEPSISVAAAEGPAPTRSQPQPVYPDGPSEMDISAPPSMPVAAAEPYDLSSQPQPVVPEFAAAAPEPVDLSSQPQPVVPEPAAEPEPAEPATAEATPAEPQPEASPPEPSTPAVVAEQPSAERPAEPKSPPVVFKSVDYEDKDARSGTVSLAGVGEPGARILLYYDEEPLGEVIIGDDGSWAFEIEKKVEAGEHNFRADRVDAATGIVVGRASIGMMRLEPPKEEVAAAPEPAAPPAPTAGSEGASGEQVAAGEEATPAAESEGQAQHGRDRPNVYTVQRGDTLWDIAEEYFGGGWRYRAIVRENRRKIRNPHWIYPDQEFRLPAQR